MTGNKLFCLLALLLHFSLFIDVHLISGPIYRQLEIIFTHLQSILCIKVYTYHSVIQWTSLFPDLQSGCFHALPHGSEPWSSGATLWGDQICYGWSNWTYTRGSVKDALPERLHARVIQVRRMALRSSIALAWKVLCHLVMLAVLFDVIMFLLYVATCVFKLLHTCSYTVLVQYVLVTVYYAGDSICTLVTLIVILVLVHAHHFITYMERTIYDSHF